ncbi:MFS transporter [Lentzea tibetensis]|uniref:MFS transporter n=1 Tax=Lentzea tibetensis TaxID=2591470 RepID=A0A563EJP6_9PSEU|nr:MFS transporter [Lentzea tibetensis]TWP47241.1 MFS transporter [Lentzea tibetensis]
MSEPRAARFVTTAVFVAHAIGFGAWTPHIPLVKDRLDLSEATLGFALFGASVGSVAAMLLCGPVIARCGSRRVTAIALVAYALTNPLLGLAWSPLSLFVALTLWGGAQGLLGVAMNSQAVTVERAYPRPIMSSIHAFWSLGAFLGVTIGSVFIRFGFDLAQQMVVIAAVFVLATWPLARPMLTDRVEVEQHRLALPWRDRRLLALGGLMFAALLVEGAVGDWSAVYLRESLGAPESLSGLGYSVFAMTMFTGRALGDRWVGRFGARRVLGTLALVGGSAMAVALMIGSFWPAVAGFTVIGIGLSCNVPVMYSAAAGEADGHAAHAIAAVSTAGWAGLLIGPVLIGMLAHVTSLPIALGLLPLLCLVVAFGSRILR